MTNDSTQSHHERILSTLRDNIISGVWRAGQKIPFETEMAVQYGVSRMTMNKVLTQLSREGFLERRRKVGTFVRSPRVQSALMNIPNIGEEIREIGREHSFSTVASTRRAAAEQDRRLLRTGEHSPFLLFVEAVHYADQAAFCHEWRLVNLDKVPAATDLDLANVHVGTWLLSNVAWSEAEHTITAVNPSAEIAHHLGLKSSTACLQVERLTESDGAPITYARMTYRGDMHQFVARFVPTGQPTSAAAATNGARA